MNYNIVYITIITANSNFLSMISMIDPYYLTKLDILINFEE